MISIKRFLEHRREDPAEHDVIEAAVQMGRLLLDAVSTHFVGGRDADSKTFGRTIKELLRRLDKPPTAFSLLEISSEAVEAIETHAVRTTEYFREQNEQLQSMVAMLTETLADVSGQNDASVSRLQAIEQQIVRTSGLEDMRALSANLENCLSAVREAAAQQKRPPPQRKNDYGVRSTWLRREWPRSAYLLRRSPSRWILRMNATLLRRRPRPPQPSTWR